MFDFYFANDSLFDELDLTITAREMQRVIATGLSLYAGLCRDKAGKTRKLHRGKGSLHGQRIEQLGGILRDAISFHLPFPDHMHRLMPERMTRAQRKFT